MRVLNIVPEKIHVTFSIDTDELALLHRALNMCKVEFNGNDPQDVDSKNFFINDFSKTISDLVKELLEHEN